MPVDTPLGSTASQLIVYIGRNGTGDGTECWRTPSSGDSSDSSDLALT